MASSRNLPNESRNLSRNDESHQNQRSNSIEDNEEEEISSEKIFSSDVQDPRKFERKNRKHCNIEKVVCICSVSFGIILLIIAAILQFYLLIGLRNLKSIVSDEKAKQV